MFCTMAGVDGGVVLRKLSFASEAQGKHDFKSAAKPHRRSYQANRSIVDGGGAGGCTYTFAGLRYGRRKVLLLSAFICDPQRMRMRLGGLERGPDGRHTASSQSLQERQPRSGDSPWLPGSHKVLHALTTTLSGRERAKTSAELRERSRVGSGDYTASPRRPTTPAV